jgi:hypothetical protein
MNRSFAPCLLVGAASLLTVAFASSNAHALGPLDLEIGAKAGVGTMPSNENAPNPLGFGIGGRGGIAIAGFYGGVSAVYYLGESQNASAPLSGSVSKHSLLYGVEGGYGWKLLDLLTIRPQIGVGQMTLWTSSSVSTAYGAVAGPSVDQSTNALYLEPGVTAMISLGTFFVGADANALIIPSLNDPTVGKSQTDIAFTLHGQLGVKF